MKKYVKPELFYEKYELTQHIADCAWEFKEHTTVDNCYAQGDSEKVPIEGNLFVSHSNCTVTPDVYDDYCYHDGAQGVNVFIS